VKDCEMDNDIKTLMEQNSSRFVGLRQVMRGINEGTIWCVIVSSDCEERIKTNIISAAKSKKIRVEMCESMQQLGSLSGIDVPAAVVGLIGK